MQADSALISSVLARAAAAPRLVRHDLRQRLTIYQLLCELPDDCEEARVRLHLVADALMTYAETGAWPRRAEKENPALVRSC